MRCAAPRRRTRRARAAYLRLRSPLLMSTIHVTNGDHAAEILREALQTAARDERVIPLKDDLAVGQLRGIDENPGAVLAAGAERTEGRLHIEAQGTGRAPARPCARQRTGRDLARPERQ